MSTPTEVVPMTVEMMAELEAWGRVQEGIHAATLIVNLSLQLTEAEKAMSEFYTAAGFSHSTETEKSVDALNWARTAVSTKRQAILDSWKAMQPDPSQ